MVRVRFAPSPTGPLHIGGVRTAIYNFLFARKHNGTFILRIEDTDQLRYVPGAESYIIDSLTWCGIIFDEGPHVGGQYGPYRQSERLHIYQQYALELVKNGYAYYAFETADELEQLRQSIPNFQYDSKTRKQLKNSLTLPPSEVEKLVRDGYPYVIRMKIPENTTIIVDDIIRGQVEFHSDTLDDKVLFKSDGFPTYHLANVVDDHLMHITHVIRGEEWLPSAPLHVYMYKCFGWEMPKFAHLPLILKPSGQGKLSKRDGDTLGFPVFPCNWTDPQTNETYPGYREWGYLPEAFVNMIALLGWNPGTEQEIMNIHQMIELFELEKVQKSGARFDPEKTRWFNHQYILKTDLAVYLPFFRNILQQHNVSASDAYILSILEEIKDRLYLLSDFWEHAYYFFTQPQHYDQQVLHKFLTPQSYLWLTQVSNLIEQIHPFVSENIEASLKHFLQEQQIPTGKIFNLIRIALTGSNKGISLPLIMQIIGKNETISRISVFMKYIQTINE